MASKGLEGKEGEVWGEIEREERRDGRDGSGERRCPGRGSGSTNPQLKRSPWTFGDPGSESNRSDSVALSLVHSDISLFPCRELELEVEPRLDVLCLVLSVIALPLVVADDVCQRVSIWKVIYLRT